EPHRLARGGRVTDPRVEPLGLRRFEVVLPKADQRPGVGQTTLDAHEEVGVVRGARRLVQNDALILEVEALADRYAYSLGARLGIEEPRRKRERELIGVADAIVAQVAVDGEELREIEVVDRRVEGRRLALVLIRYVDVDRARFERLDAAQSEFLHIPLEDEPGVDRRDRNHVILAGRNVGPDLLEVVLTRR